MTTQLTATVLQLGLIPEDQPTVLRYEHGRFLYQYLPHRLYLPNTTLGAFEAKAAEVIDNISAFSSLPSGVVWCRLRRNMSDIKLPIVESSFPLRTLNDSICSNFQHVSHHIVSTELVQFVFPVTRHSLV